MVAISVLMTVYNGEKYLRQAIDSILNQTYKAFEFVIVNDGSTDQSLEIINSYDDPRIKVISYEKNCGVAHARNIGLEYCISEYVAIMDADDIALPERLEISYKFLKEHEDIDAVYGKILILNTNGELCESIYPMISDNYKYIEAYLILNNTVTNPAAIFRKQIVEKNCIKYDETLEIASDYKFWCDYSRHGKIVGIDHILCYYRMRNHSLYNNAPLLKQVDAERRIKIYNCAQFGFDFLDEEKEILIKVFGIPGEISSMEEMILLYRTFLKMIKQAEEKKLEIVEEIRVMCKNRFLEKLQKADVLWGGGI